tara:strand:- start:238 stop:435 length:198 start_codon:yes stop_codon:yes gene_type:complete
MKEKIKKISKIENDLNYLRGEYKNIVLWGTIPDGDVSFESLIEWFANNEDVAKFMLDTAKELNEI